MEKILVVDDDQSILKVIKMRLEAKDYLVCTYTDADTAVKAARQDSFDLALVDLKLGKENGIMLMNVLHEINPEMPIFPGPLPSLPILIINISLYSRLILLLQDMILRMETKYGRLIPCQVKSALPLLMAKDWFLQQMNMRFWQP